MNEGSDQRVTNSPLTAPQAAPVTRASATAAASGSFQSASATPSTAPESASSDPTDRSMPPAMITNVMPVATSSTSGTWLAIVRMVVGERK